MVGTFKCKQIGSRVGAPAPPWTSAAVEQLNLRLESVARESGYVVCSVRRRVYRERDEP